MDMPAGLQAPYRSGWRQRLVIASSWGLSRFGGVAWRSGGQFARARQDRRQLTSTQRKRGTPLRARYPQTAAPQCGVDVEQPRDNGVQLGLFLRRIEQVL